MAIDGSGTMLSNNHHDDPDHHHYHPYYPQTLLIPNYVPNASPVLYLLVCFVLAIGLFVGAGLVLGIRHDPSLGKEKGRLLTVVWFLLCGFLHVFFEGYFIFNHKEIPSSQSLFAQLWKEYSLSDSRYISGDPFMLCIEILTWLIWAPLSLLTAFFVITSNSNSSSSSSSSSNSSYRHILQIVVSIGHLYGCLLYYGTCYFIELHQGTSYSRPEALYYWGYYVGCNAPWIIVPCLLIWQSVKEIGEGSNKVLERKDKKMKLK